MSRLPVILNPTAGGGRLLRHQAELTSCAAANAAELDICQASSREHTIELAAAAAAEGVPLVLAYGGDGTYNAVAHGLLGSDTAMGVLPGGTTSVMAYEFKVPRPAHRAVEALIHGIDREMHVGRTNRGDLVLLMLSAGPDSHVLERLSPRFKKLGGRVGVALQGLVELLRGDSLPRLLLSTDGEAREMGWVIVGNARCYGGRHAATPEADPFRGDFEVVSQLPTGRGAASAFLLGIPKGRHVHRRDVMRMVADCVRLEPVDGGVPVPYQVDGDVVGTLPVEIRIDPQRLKVRLPATD